MTLSQLSLYDLIADDNYVTVSGLKIFLWVRERRLERVLEENVVIFAAI